jgi:hypothetical protein
VDAGTDDERAVKGMGIARAKALTDDPVSQPLLVVILSWRFEGLTGKVGWKDPSGGARWTHGEKGEARSEETVWV